MDNRLLTAVFLIVAFAALSVFSVVSYAATATSPSTKFNVTDSGIAINHTNNLFANISIGAASTDPGTVNSYTVMLINNISTTISTNYSQPALSEVICGNTGAFRPAIANTTGWFNETVVANNTNQTVAIFLSTPQLACSPGRYFGYFNVTNSTNTTDTLAIELRIDIPITNSTAAFNTSSTGQQVGIYNGTLAAFAPAAHSYFFDTGAIKKATGVVINLTAANDVDVFILDSNGVLQGKSINDDPTKTVITSFNPSDQFWEIRLFGNRSSSVTYTGVIVFSALNISLSNGTTTESLGLVRYGTLRAGDSKTLNVSLTNNGDLNYTGITERTELKHVKAFGLSNGTRQFDLLVPGNTTKIKVSVNWTSVSGINVTNYTLSLTAPNGTLINTSVNKYLNANASSVELEEFIETSDTPQGVWNITVANFSTTYGTGGYINNNYTVVANIFYDTTNRITTNFSSTDGTIARDGLANDTVNLEWKVIVQNDTLPGLYEGFIEYRAAQGAITRSKFTYTVQSASIVANQTFNSSTVVLEQNRGSGIYAFANVTLNNTGDLAATLTSTNSSLALVHTSNSSSLVNFTYNITAGFSLGAKGNTTINITFNASPDVSTGSHVGWIFVNSTDSHPYQGFNLSLMMNVSDSLEVSITEILSNDMMNHTFETDNTKNETFENENITVRAQIRFVNGTLLDDTRANSDWIYTNFSVYMRHQNVSFWSVPANGSMQLMANQSWGATGAPTQPPNPVYSVDRDTFNVTAMIFNDSSGSVGGPYDIHFVAYMNATPTGPLYIGQAIFNNYTLRNASFQMSSNFSTCALGSACSASSTLSGTQNVSVNISNFGPLPASGGTGGSITINLTAPNCAGYKTTANAAQGCGASEGGGESWTISPGIGERCYVSWNVIPISDASACTASVQANRENMWFSSSAVNISFTVDVDDPAAPGGGGGSGSSSSSSSSSTSSSSTTSTTAAKYLEISQWKSIIEIVQGGGGNSTVTVKNVNDTLTQNVFFSVIDLNSSFDFVAGPSSREIEAGDSFVFTAKFNASEKIAVDEYPGKFQASSAQQTVTAPFSIHVLPGATEKARIASDFEKIRDEFNALWNDINSSKAFGTNVTETEALFAQLKSKFDEAEAQLALGTDQGYFAANQLLKEIRNLLDTTKAQLTVDKQGGLQFPVDPLYIGIGIGVAAVGFLIYLFLPTKGEGAAARIKNVIKPGTSGRHAHSDHGISFKKPFQKVGGKFDFYKKGGQAKEAADSVKDATKEGLRKLKEKFKLRREYKYRYEE